MNIRSISLVVCIYTTATVGYPVFAQEGYCSHHHCVDWQSLNLSEKQDGQIRAYQTDWNSKYFQYMPQIRHQQQHLQELFRDPHADPLEIVNTQQSVMRLQEQLRNEATANYLHKRSVLSDLQQKQLESQLHQMVVERQQRSFTPASDQSEDTGGLSNIMQKIRWAIGPH